MPLKNRKDFQNDVDNLPESGMKNKVIKYNKIFCDFLLKNNFSYPSVYQEQTDEGSLPWITFNWRSTNNKINLLMFIDEEDELQVFFFENTTRLNDDEEFRNLDDSELFTYLREKLHYMNEIEKK